MTPPTTTPPPTPRSLKCHNYIFFSIRFLTGGKSNKPKKPTAATSGDSIPLLQGKKETTDNLHLEEVQEQLKKTHPLLATKGQWKYLVLESIW